tara:strand:- start:216 stop:482 length:267 start_codon:yes stop_codon:yes gene_type:complete
MEFYRINLNENSHMNEDNRQKLWTLIKEIGDHLKGKLPNHPNHPKGRNPYAHVAIEVKNHFGLSYKDIPDEKYDEVINYLKKLKENPS